MNEIKCKDCLKFINGKCTAGKLKIQDGKCLNEIRDNVKFYQHKYYRGIILQEIAFTMGETDHLYVHNVILKPRWLYQTTGQAFYEYKQYTDIPEKIKASGSVWQLDTGNFAAIPSMSKFTIKEAKSFIEFCEHFLFFELQGCIREENNKDYMNLKNKLK